MSEVHVEHLGKYWRNETVDEIIPVFAEFF